ncbi:MAG: 5'-methylthioadenosine/S-adenosylhomocysteine nucleosidase [Candidatus Zixiibacteriota bacterium]
MGRYFMRKIIILIFFTIIISSSFFITDCRNSSIKSDYYLILYAFDTEGALLADSMQITRTETVLGRTVHIGTLCNRKIILAESGMGLTNAALTAQKLIDLYYPCGVFFTGIAGAVDSTVKIGDIAVCDRWLTHDYGYLGAEGLKTSEVKVTSISSDTLSKILEFPVDSFYFNLALKLTDKALSLESIGERQPRLIFSGIGVSGNTFIDNIDRRQDLSGQFGALTVDMETAAVAQVCYVNEIPFLAFRSASDLAGGSGSSTADKEIDRFFKIAAVNSSKVLMSFLKEL